ncbi:MAG: inositol monophosphatase, partial [Planctomycetes bacterium]|nr:inositol monophosphatase [Planctomycetota bacterium]
DRGSARYCWVVDPLDGTRNFIAGFPCFSTSIAVLDQGHPVIGVVFEHNLRQMYTAVRGRGAWFLGSRVNCVWAG